MVLLILYFVPFDLLTPQESFDAVSEKLFVSPVVRTLVFTKASREEVGLSESAFTDAKNFNSFHDSLNLADWNSARFPARLKI